MGDIGAAGFTAQTCASVGAFKCFKFISNGLNDLLDSTD